MSGLKTLWYKIIGKRITAWDISSGNDHSCKVTGYWIGDKLMITKLEYFG